MGGGLSVGAATISAGYHAWNENLEWKSEDEVGLLLHSHCDFSLLTLEDTSSRGVCRDGSVMLMCAPRNFATTVLVLPRPGFLLMDVTIFLAQP